MQDAGGKDAGQVELVLKWVDNSQYKDTKLLVKVLRARNLMAMDMDGTSDPYIVLKYGKQEHRGNKVASPPHSSPRGMSCLHLSRVLAHCRMLVTAPLPLGGVRRSHNGCLAVSPDAEPRMEHAHEV